MTSPVRLRALDWLLLGLLLGLASGLGELAFLGVRKFVFGHWLRLGPHTLWMVPAVQAVMGTVLGGMLAALQIRGKGPGLAPVGTAVLAFMAMLPFAVGQPWLDKRAALLLALGIAVQVGRSGLLHRPMILRSGAWVTPWLVSAVALTAVGTPLLGRLLEDRRLRDLGTADPRAPNVLLLILDTVRAASLGAYGHEHDTAPYLTRLAGEGIRFGWAFAPSPWTLPSHATFFTGSWPHELSADWNSPLDRRDPTLAEAFTQAGYATGGFVANYSYLMRESGLARGFHRWQPFPVTLAEAIGSSSVGRWLATSSFLRHRIGSQEVLGRKSARAVNRELLDWLDDLPDARPFFAVLNYYDAHEPYLPPPPFRDRFGDGAIPFHPNTHIDHRYVLLPAGERRATDPGAQAANRNAYDGAIAYLDAEIEALLTELDGRGLLDRTVVVVTSDHGEGMGEAGRWLHGTDLNSPTVRVPLIIRFPSRVRPGGLWSEPVSLRDLAATLADLASLPESLRVFPGTSLTAAWSDEGTAPGPSPVLLSVWPWENTTERWFGLVEAEWHYVRTHKGEEQLYRYRVDSLEVDDLSTRQEYRHVMEKMRARVDTLIAGTRLSLRPRPDLVGEPSRPWARGPD